MKSLQSFFILSCVFTSLILISLQVNAAVNGSSDSSKNIESLKIDSNNVVEISLPYFHIKFSLSSQFGHATIYNSLTYRVIPFDEKIPSHLDIRTYGSMGSAKEKLLKTRRFGNYRHIAKEISLTGGTKSWQSISEQNDTIIKDIAYKTAGNITFIKWKSLKENPEQHETYLENFSKSLQVPSNNISTSEAYDKPLNLKIAAPNAKWVFLYRGGYLKTSKGIKSGCFNRDWWEIGNKPIYCYHYINDLSVSSLHEALKIGMNRLTPHGKDITNKMIKTNKKLNISGKEALYNSFIINMDYIKMKAKLLAVKTEQNKYVYFVSFVPNDYAHTFKDELEKFQNSIVFTK